MSGLRSEPLDAEAFAPFGAVLAPVGIWTAANQGRARRYPAVDLARGPGLPPRAALETAIYCITASRLPFAATVFERHPHTAQLFHPATHTDYVVCVAPARADGAPEVAGARAFRAAGPLGIVYAPGVWHLPLIALDADGEFLMQMWGGAGDEDCVEHRLDQPLLITR